MRHCTSCSRDDTQVKFSARAKSCNRCYVKSKRERDLEVRSRGLCYCGQPLVAERKQCVNHLAQSTTRTKNKQIANKRKGLCPCGRERDGHLLHCRQCLDRAWLTTQPRKKEMKRRVVELLGGCCRMCGFVCPEHPEVFDLHHLDPSTKISDISSLLAAGAAWDVVEAEALKCDLLCANCHRIRHGQESYVVRGAAIGG